MLNKPLSHLRPLLRIPTHHTPQPDHFTANPSLLHHLPGANNAHGHAITQVGGNAASSSSSAGSNGAGAGRAGWAGSGAGSGGYTGHARAFLSLSQTGAVDPSSSLTNTDDQRQQAAAARQSAILKNRLGRTIKVVDMDEPVAGSSSQIPRQLIGREAGGGRSTLRAVDLGFDEDMEGPSRTGGRAVESRRTRRRSSIVFPSSPAEGVAEVPEAVPPLPRARRPVSTSRPRGIHRSTSSSELWQVGITSRPAHLSIRPLSSRAGTIDLPLVEDLDEPSRDVTALQPMSAHRIPQPNRILQDLAGRDLPSQLPSINQIRHNSTAAAARSDTTDDIILTKLSGQGRLRTSEEDAAANADRKRDRDIYNLLRGSIAHQRKDYVRDIIEHYRRPRQASPFGPSLTPELRRLEDRFPLPSIYQIDTYNLCLEGVLALRRPGESIAPVLDMYNEMIERDVVPSWKTYALVIRALALRETDIAHVAQQWKQADELSVWRRAGRGVSDDKHLDHARAETLEGYRSEGNFASAMKLFQTSVLLNQHEWKLPSATYRDLLDAAVASAESSTSTSDINVQAAMDVLRHGMTRNVSGMRGLYANMFRLCALKGDREALTAMWEEFHEGLTNGHGAVPSEWIVRDLPSRLADDSVSAETEQDRAPQMLRAVEQVWASAVESFVRVGDVAEAEQIMQQMLDSANHDVAVDEFQQNLRIPARATPETYVRMVLALEECGDHDAADAWWSKMTFDPVLSQLYATSGVYDLPIGLASRSIYRFTCNDRFDRAYDVLTCPLWSTTLRSQLSPLVIRPVYAGLVQLGLQAVAAGRKDEAYDIATVMLPAVLLRLSERAGSGSKTAADGQAVFGTCKLLVEVGRTDLIADVLSQFPVTGFKSQTLRDLGDLLAASLEQLPLPDALSTVAEFRRKNSNRSSGPLASAALRLFEQVRGTTEKGAAVITAQQHWTDLLECASSLETRDVQDGSFDDVLSRLMEDVSVEDAYCPEGPIKLVWLSDLARILVNRFGEERSAQWMKPFWQQGQVALNAVIAEQARPVASTPDPVSLSQADAQPVPDLDSASVTSFETSAQPSTPPPVQDQRPPQPRYYVDTETSAELDKILMPHNNEPRKCMIAYQRLKSGLQQGRVLHPRTLGRLIAALGRDGQEGRMREVYDLAQVALSLAPEGQQPDLWRQIEDSMIMGMCALGHLEAAGMHRARLLEAGMSPSPDAYGTMIASSKDTTDDAMVALSLFEEAVQNGVRPHLYLYNTVISKLSKARKAEAALTLFAQLKADGLKPTSVTYGALINGCCRVGDAESAETLFKEMTQMRNFKPRVPPYNTMMQFYLQTVPSRERVLHYYQLLLQSGIGPSAHTYKLLLDAYTMLEPVDIASMERVYQALQADPHVQVQGTHYASVITAFGKHVNDVDRAIAFFNAIPAQQLESVVWEALLNVLAQTGTLAQLEEFHGRLFSSHVAPTAYVYNALITGYARLGQIERARDIFESMGDSIVGVAAPNNHPTLLTNSGHHKPSTTTDAPTGVVYREPSTYTRMITAELEHGGSRDRAEAVLARMEARAYPYAVFAKARSLLYGPDVLPGSTASPQSEDDAARHQQINTSTDAPSATSEPSDKSLQAHQANNQTGPVL